MPTFLVCCIYTWRGASSVYTPPDLILVELNITFAYCEYPLRSLGSIPTEKPSNGICTRRVGCWDIMDTPMDMVYSVHILMNQNAYGRSKKSLIHPGNTLRNQELIQSLISIEPAPATILHTAMGKSRLIMDRHAINMDRPAKVSTDPPKSESRSATPTYPD